MSNEPLAPEGAAMKKQTTTATGNSNEERRKLLEQGIREMYHRFPSKMGTMHS